MAEAANPTNGAKPAGSTEPANNPKEPTIDAKTFSISLPDGAGHKGTLTVNDNAPIESIILAYQAIHKLAHHISDRVIQLNDKKLPVFFHNAADFGALRELRACLALCDEYTSLFKTLTKEANDELLPDEIFGKRTETLDLIETIITGVAVFSGLLSSGLQLMSLFRTDQEIKSYKIDVEDQVLAITVAGHLKQHTKEHGEFKVYHSAIVPVDPLAKSNVMSLLHQLNKAREELSELSDRLGKEDKPVPTASSDQTTLRKGDDSDSASAAEQLAEELGTLTPPSDEDSSVGEASPAGHQSAPAGTKRVALDEAIARRLAQHSADATPTPGQAERRAQLRARIAEALKDFDAFQQSLCKIDDKSNSSSLSRILTGESLEARLKGGAYILWVKAVVAGGMSHARVSSGKSSLTYGAGAIVSYAIFNADGTMVEANTIPLYGGKLSVDQLPGVTLKATLFPDEENDDATKGKGLQAWWDFFATGHGQ